MSYYHFNHINHKYYHFAEKAKETGRLFFIPEPMRVNFKFCETCNICYKKSYFNSHKKTRFHRTKQAIINDKNKKIHSETNLETTINQNLGIMLKNNDINIGNIICEYLQDTCCDCKEETVNPTIIIRGREKTNICQHCYNKYNPCYYKSCNFIGTDQYFHRCVDCNISSCKIHMKKIEKKYRCIDCSHNFIDEIFQLEKITNKIKSQSKVIKYCSKDLNKMTRNIKELNFRLIRKNNDLSDKNAQIFTKNNELSDKNRQISAKNNEISNLRNDIEKLKEKYEQKLLEQKASFFDKFMLLF